MEDGGRRTEETKATSAARKMTPHLDLVPRRNNGTQWETDGAPQSCSRREEERSREHSHQTFTPNIHTKQHPTTWSVLLVLSALRPVTEPKPVKHRHSQSWKRRPFTKENNINDFFFLELQFCCLNFLFILYYKVASVRSLAQLQFNRLNIKANI